MLRIQPVRSPNDAKKLLESFDPRTATWLVSDLKSKLDLNRRLLKKTEFVPSAAVMRASELWRALLTRTRADLQIVSREFALTLIADRLAKTDLAWAQGPGVASTVFDYMTQLMPVLAHPSGEEIMADWFSRNEASHARWGRWFEISEFVWKVFLKDGFIAAPWASGVLVNEGDLSRVWSRSLVVDLGAELTQVEADLLLVLGDHLDVVVLKPEPSWRAEASRTLNAYDVLEAKQGAKRENFVESPFSQPSTSAFRKYTTMIAEVKDATAQVRRWLDEEKLSPADIAIVAPDIEPYWFSLSNYLEVEGIPTQKERVRRLHGFPDVAQWLARLRLKMGGHDESDLELAIFAAPLTGAVADKKLISFNEFKTVFAAIYGREDLARRPSVAAAFESDLDRNEIVARDEFIPWALKYLPSGFDADRIETGLKRVLGECPESLTLPVHRWLSYFEEALARIEIRIGVGDPNGIACLRLSSAESSPAKKMIIMGLTDTALKKNLSTSILFSDLWSLAQEFGFHLASEDQNQAEFEIRWLIEGGGRELVLSAPETDFNGAVQAPSWLWVKGSREAEQPIGVTVPEPTRWDEIQKGELQAIAVERAWNQDELASIARSIAQDFNDEEMAAYAHDVVTSLSPSRIQDYLECPFIFAAKHLFRLADDTELDLEVDPLRRGSLMHAVFELLTPDEMRYEFTDDELGLLVDEARRKAKVELADERLWKPLRMRHVDLAKRFLTFEREYRREFPDVKTVGREFEVSGFVNRESGELISGDGVAEGEGLLRFSGRIDRIDSDSKGHLAIFDYKSSDGSASQHGSWIKNNRIQLLLYSLAIEKGLTALKARPVLAALYYVARPFSRDTGFMVEGPEQKLFSITNKRKKNRVSEAEKEKLFSEGRELVRKAAEGIASGRFAADPRDPKTCLDCRWSLLCRTPHLNS